MKDKINYLYNKDNEIAYKNLLDLEVICTESNELYNYFDDILKLLNDNNSFIRVRGFRLICYLAKWDKDNKINKNINLILNELDDNTSTSVRQSLQKLNLILLYKPELSSIIEEKLNKLDISKYKETMQSLIKKDITNLLDNI
jgi:Glu-tRNA(Gln) amidotransferase subunit E-like FAD-binding protein